VGISVLLDTHALIWWLTDNPRLSDSARQIISDGETRVFVSSATAWEISTKHRLGKLPEIGNFIEKFSSYLRRERFEPLPISIEHSLHAGMLPGPHRDPFDRMLIAQATLQCLQVITIDPVFAEYGVSVVW
jgi:PIN domain nuclease of toxin-antitoxin system